MEESKLDGIHFCGSCGLGFKTLEDIEFHMDNIEDVCNAVRGAMGLPLIENPGEAGLSLSFSEAKD